MKLETDGDTVAVETGPEDKQLADAIGTIVTGAGDLLDAVGTGECDWCDDRGRLRPYALTVDGEFRVLDVCAECQRDFVTDATEEVRGESDSDDFEFVGDA